MYTVVASKQAIENYSQHTRTAIIVYYFDWVSRQCICLYTGCFHCMGVSSMYCVYTGCFYWVSRQCIVFTLCVSTGCLVNVLCLHWVFPLGVSSMYCVYKNPCGFIHLQYTNFQDCSRTSVLGAVEPRVCPITPKSIIKTVNIKLKI